MKTVILAYDPTWAALEWAKAHCKSYITNTVAAAAAGYADMSLSDRFAVRHRIEYFFGDERDATMFRLMWA